jgi:hypothetical protein
MIQRGRFVLASWLNNLLVEGKPSEEEATVFANNANIAAHRWN